MGDPRAAAGMEGERGGDLGCGMRGCVEDGRCGGAFGRELEGEHGGDLGSGCVAARRMEGAGEREST
jgi:hypothetical protein